MNPLFLPKMLSGPVGDLSAWIKGAPNGTG